MVSSWLRLGQTALIAFLLVGIVGGGFLGGTAVAQQDASRVAIDSDAGLASVAASRGWPGSGTAADPYIIDGYVFENEPFYASFKISNTRAHFIIKNCTFDASGSRSSSSFGLEMRNVRNATIEDSVFSGGVRGTLHWFISSTYIPLGPYSYEIWDPQGIYVKNSEATIRSNLFEPQRGAAIHAVRSHVVVEDNTFDNVGSGLVAQAVGSSIFRNNEVRSTGNGIWASPSDQLEITGNMFTGGGVQLHGANGARVADNNITSPAINAVYVGTSQNTVVERNHLVGLSGVYTGRGSGNVVRENEISADRGLVLTGEIGSEFTRNRVLGSGVGIDVNGGAKQNLIYDNMFASARNYLIVPGSHSNVWSIAKTAGTNVVGGPFMGGNFWSDYVGLDQNGDGLGDQPYGAQFDSTNMVPRDWRPLVVPTV